MERGDAGKSEGKLGRRWSIVIVYTRNFYRMERSVPNSLSSKRNPRDWRGESDVI